MPIAAAAAAVAAVLFTSPAAAVEMSCRCDSCCARALPLPPVALPPAGVPSTPTWGGVYVGVTFGFIDNNVHQSENGPGHWPAAYGTQNYTDRYSHGSGHLALHGGYNHQAGAVVIGVEGDVGFAPGHWSKPGLVGDRDYFDPEWDASLRLRGGYADGKLLLYGTAGPAVAEAKMGLDGFSTSKVHLGWTAGVGSEYQLSPNWIGRIETRYSKFGDETYETIHGPADMGWHDKRASIGISYKF